MLRTDVRALWDPTIIPDTRATQYWDKDKTVSSWLSHLSEDYDGVDWDVYYLFGPDARWDEKPTPIRSVGATILFESDKLLESIEPLLHK